MTSEVADKVPKMPFFRRQSTLGSLYQVPTLDEAMDQFSGVFDAFFRNQFREALTTSSLYEKKSLYHSQAKAFLCFINAMVGVEKSDVEEAVDAIDETLKMCFNNRRRTSILQSVTRVLTRVEIHGELISAETRLMTVLLRFVKEDHFANFVKHIGVLKHCMQSYKQCLEVLESRKNWASDESETHFKSGVYLGIGTLNLFISRLPEKVRRQLELANCVGDEATGVKYLKDALDIKDGIKYPIAVLVTLWFHLFMDQLCDSNGDNLEWPKKLVSQMMDKYKDSVFLRFNMAQIKQRKGDIKGAIDMLQEAADAQEEWSQLKGICISNIMWCQALQGNWDKAASAAKTLADLNKQYPEVNLHQYASFLCMKQTEEGSTAHETEIKESMRKVVSKFKDKNKLSSLQMLAYRSAKRFGKKYDQPIAPTLELLYHYDTFQYVGASVANINILLEQVEMLLEKLVVEKLPMSEIDDPFGAPLDDYALLKLLKGACFRYLDKRKAIECFKEIIEKKERLSDDCILAAVATIELGATYVGIGMIEEGKFWLENAREEHSDVLKEIKYLLRVERAFEKLNQGNSKAEMTKRRASMGDILTKRFEPSIPKFRNRSKSDAAYGITAW